MTAAFVLLCWHWLAFIYGGHLAKKLYGVYLLKHSLCIVLSRVIQQSRDQMWYRVLRQ